MNAILHTILQDQHTGYCIITPEGAIAETGGDLDWLPESQRPFPGQQVFESFPELIGYENGFADILAGTLPRLELPYINREGPDHLYYLNLSLRAAPPSHPDRLLLIIHDVSEVGALEQLITQHRNEIRLLHALQTHQNIELQTLNRQLQRLTEIKAMFVSIAAHEFRSPLTVLQGYLDLLTTGPDPLTSRQREFITILQQSVEHLISLTQMLLDVNRLQTEQLDLTLEVCHLPTLVADAVTRFTPQLRTKQQSVRLHLPETLPPVLCDSTRIQQVLDNLLQNAHKYTPEGSTITITLEPRLPDMVACTIEDDGHGINAEEIANLFTPFYRGTQARQNGTQGTGLGLYIARSIIELHGGTLTCSSRPGHGARFTFTLPVVDEPIPLHKEEP